MKLQLVLAALALTCSAASASTFDIFFATDLFTPTFRGDANSTWVGWDTFDDNLAGDMIINDVTPDIGTDTGSFVTNNGEDHISGSFNYYSGFGSINETITFDADGTAGSGYTTIIVQAKTLFGGLGTVPAFTPINGVLPTVVSGTNAAGQGQLFAKYELVPGVDGAQAFSIVSGPFSFASFDQFVVDTVWSATGIAPDNAIATPEPASALLVLLTLGGVAATRRV